MPKISIGQGFYQTRCLSLSLRKQQELRAYWNQKLQDPFAFIPSDDLLRGNLSEQTAMEENVKIGNFAASYFGKVISQNLTEHVRIQRIKDGKIVLAVGFGKGYDLQWFEAAILAGFQIWWIDISDIAYKAARVALSTMWKNTHFPSGDRPLKPVVIRSDIQSVLADPDSIGLDFGKVSYWYLSRLLGCLGKTSFKTVLQQIGWETFSGISDPHRENGVVIVNALKDYNPDVTSKTSVPYTKRSLIKNLTTGAGHAIEVGNEEHCQFLSKIVTAMTLKAEKEPV